MKKLVQSAFSYYEPTYADLFENTQSLPGRVSYGSNRVAPRTQSDYLNDIEQCRYFYKYDPIASSVINRMTELAISVPRVKRGVLSDADYHYYRYVARKITPMLRVAAREFLVTGMAIPEFSLSSVMANRIHPSLGRTRMVIPETLSVRNPEFIALKRIPLSIRRRAYAVITPEELHFIQTEGTFTDGTIDKQLYREFAKTNPQYVEAVRAGTNRIPIDHTLPVLRKVMTNDDYPQPYLTAALSALRHKARIKQMDYSIATKALEAVRHIKVGNDLFPVEDGDSALADLEGKIAARSNYTKESVYTLFTNHTVEMGWVYPPLDALLSEGKYSEPNADIFLALGFSRALLVGESLRSNASQNVSASLGPLATIDEMRSELLEWISYLCAFLAEENDIRFPAEMYFAPISSVDLASLAAFAVDAAKIGAISKDTVASVFGKTYNDENDQIETETPIIEETPNGVEQG